MIMIWYIYSCTALEDIRNDIVQFSRTMLQKNYCRDDYKE